MVQLALQGRMLRPCAVAGFDPTLGAPEARHGPLPRTSGTARVVGSVAEELAAAQGSSQACGHAITASCRRWHMVVTAFVCLVFCATQVVLEGDLVNLAVTSPAAALALGLMYLQTNDAEVAAAFQLPDTHFALDFVQPDQLTLRMLMRALGEHGQGGRLRRSWPACLSDLRCLCAMQ